MSKKILTVLLLSTAITYVTAGTPEGCGSKYHDEHKPTGGLQNQVMLKSIYDQLLDVYKGLGESGSKTVSTKPQSTCSTG